MKLDLPRRWIPTCTLKHEDEVWNVRWSHDGELLASASKDGQILLSRFSISADSGHMREYRRWDFNESITSIAWSPDDTRLLIGSDNAIVRICDTNNGDRLLTIKAHDDLVSALAWLPDGLRFLSGSMNGDIILWDTQGKAKRWTTTRIRVNDFVLAPDASKLFAVGSEFQDSKPKGPALQDQSSSRSDSSGDSLQSSRVLSSKAGQRAPKSLILVFDMETQLPETYIVQDKVIASVDVSKNSRYVVVNSASNEAQLWDISQGRMIQKFVGHNLPTHVIRCCFGPKDQYIASGSQDGLVYIWHRDSWNGGVGSASVLSGHGKGSVNAVTWNPKYDQLLASSSDDGTVIIWTLSTP